MMDPNSNTIVIKPKFKSGVFFGLVALTILSTLAAGILIHFWLLVVLMAILTIALVILMVKGKRTVLTIVGNELSIVRPFRSGRIQLDRIVKAEIKSYGGAKGVIAYALNLYDNASYAQKPLDISLDIFSKEDMRTVVSVIISKAGTADIDETTRALAAGDYAKVFPQFVTKSGELVRR